MRDACVVTCISCFARVYSLKSTHLLCVKRNLWTNDHVFVFLFQCTNCISCCGIQVVTCQEYKNKFKRKDAFTSTATELWINNVDEVKNKIESLILQYRREKKIAMPKSGNNWKIGYVGAAIFSVSRADDSKANYFKYVSGSRFRRQHKIKFNEETTSEISSPSTPTSSMKSSRCSTPYALASFSRNVSGIDSSSGSGKYTRTKRKQVD